MPSLLVVDDDRSIIRFFQRRFEGSSTEVLAAESSAAAFAIIAKSRLDAVVLNVVASEPNGLGASGICAFEEIRRSAPAMPIVCVTGLGASDAAIESMRLGAMDYISQPLDPAEVRDVVAKAIAISRQLRQPGALAGAVSPEPSDHHSTAWRTAPGDVLIGHSAAMQTVYKDIGRVAGRNINVLIRGESGTGKELAARAIHQHGQRSGKTFLAVNCAAIPESLLESELFGHEKGAFTVAAGQHIGKFEECDGGTLFLDEVGDMPLLMQSKVLRAIQEKEFQRVGGNETIKSDVWIVAATHRDIEAMMASGAFRADLGFRLNGYSITLPALRERADDIPVLVSHFLGRFNEELGKSITDVSPETVDIMKRYAWPGNIRELQTVLKHAMLHAIGPILLPEFLPPALSKENGEPAMAQLAAANGHNGHVAVAFPPSADGHPSAESLAANLENFIAGQFRAGSHNLYAESVRYVESILLPLVLRQTRGNQSQAAALLGITRGCLRNKVRLHGITIRPSVEMSDGHEPGVDVLPARIAARGTASVGGA